MRAHWLKDDLRKDFSSSSTSEREFCSITQSGKTLIANYNMTLRKREWGKEGRSRTQDFVGMSKKKNIIEFREGLPCPEDYSIDPFSLKLVIIDDLMRESSRRRSIKGSHHKNLSVILISQNLFHQERGRVQRDISLNANYITVFKNPRDCEFDI